MAKPRLTLVLLAALVTLALAACGGGDDGSAGAEGVAASGQTAAGCEPVGSAPQPKRGIELSEPERMLPRGSDVAAVVETSCGAFEISLDTRRSPRTSSSFVHMAEEGLYDGTFFHRIVPGFVIQGGDPLGDGTGGPGYHVDEPPPEDIAYTRYLVAMAKTGVEPIGRSGSQFFIVTAPADAGLPPHYAVLGRVTGGREVIDRIAQLGDPVTEQPTQIVVVEQVRIRRG